MLSHEHFPAVQIKPEVLNQILMDPSRTYSPANANIVKYDFAEIYQHGKMILANYCRGFNEIIQL
jgi:hypothetical protein